MGRTVAEAEMLRRVVLDQDRNEVNLRLPRELTHKLAASLHAHEDRGAGMPSDLELLMRTLDRVLLGTVPPSFVAVRPTQNRAMGHLLEDDLTTSKEDK